MASIKENFKRELNYTCIYDKRKNSIVATPRTKSPFLHVLLTIGYVLLTIFLAGIARIGIEGLFREMISQEDLPWWAIGIAAFVSAVILVYMTVSLGARLGFFPRIRGGRIDLSDSPQDKKLAQLIEKHPRRLNVDWFKEWVVADKREQEKMYQEMRSALGYKTKAERKEERRQKQKAKAQETEATS